MPLLSRRRILKFREFADKILICLGDGGGVLRNSNGITDEGELSSLADNNIKSIDLNYKEITIDENSNTVKQSSKAALIDELIYEWAGVSEATKTHGEFIAT